MLIVKTGDGSTYTAQVVKFTQFNEAPPSCPVLLRLTELGYVVVDEIKAVCSGIFCRNLLFDKKVTGYYKKKQQ